MGRGGVLPLLGVLLPGPLRCGQCLLQVWSLALLALLTVPPSASGGEVLRAAAPHPPQASSVASVPPLLGEKEGVGQSAWQLPLALRYPALQAHSPFDPACWVRPGPGL